MTNLPAVYPTFKFVVEIQGITEGVFLECSGLQAEVDVEKWAEGGWNEHVHRFPGRAKEAPNLVLKNGLATSILWGWFRDVAQGRIARKNLSVILHGYEGSTPIRWDFTGALPVKWTGPTFKADATEVAVETIELIHKGFTRP